MHSVLSYTEKFNGYITVLNTIKVTTTFYSKYSVKMYVMVMMVICGFNNFL